jgi:hypothetical protein
MIPNVVMSEDYTNSAAQSRQFVQSETPENGHTCRQCGDVVESLEPSRCFYCSCILCWVCWEKTLGSCIGCTKAAREWSAKMESARVAAGLHKVGRPRVQRKCKKCGKFFGARLLREHKPVCGTLDDQVV